ncbi:H(+)-transporting ATPase [Candidatus Saccharibacteria bacterium 32-50-13]|nr:MAG: H(+)-transporting ATPase [Candidatus Saccharibacteria bacterium 32-50-13]
MDNLAFGLTFALAALGAAFAVGIIGAAALNALGRNPEKASDIRSLMITAIVFADSLAIIGVIVAIIPRFL